MNNISIIVVTYNNSRTINECLKSIVKYSPDSEIIVVDNGSTDSTLDLVKVFHEKVVLIESRSNLGFSKANNLGVKKSSRKYLVFLNPDATLTKSKDLEYLLGVLQNNPEYGILGPKFIYPDGRTQARVRKLPTVMGAIKEYIFGIKGAYDFYEPGCLSLCEVDSIIGACMILPKEIFNKVNGFNEKFFLYYEDIDMCRSIKGLGYKVGFVPEVVVVHAEGVSGANQKTALLNQASAKIYFDSISYLLLELVFLYNRLKNKLF